MKPLLIGLTGPAGSGKSFCAELLCSDHGFTRVRFAEPLKAMTLTLLRSAGVSPLTAREMVEGGLKEEPSVNLAGASPRQIMQTLGTEWGRNTIHPDFWVLMLRPTIEGLLEAGHRVVVDDVRFPNEVLMLRDLGGSIARIDGRARGISKVHPSEQVLPDPDVIIDNTTSSTARQYLHFAVHSMEHAQ